MCSLGEAHSRCATGPKSALLNMRISLLLLLLSARDRREGEDDVGKTVELGLPRR